MGITRHVSMLMKHIFWLVHYLEYLLRELGTDFSNQMRVDVGILLWGFLQPFMGTFSGSVITQFGMFISRKFVSWSCRSLWSRRYNVWHDACLAPRHQGECYIYTRLPSSAVCSWLAAWIFSFPSTTMAAIAPSAFISYRIGVLLTENLKIRPNMYLFYSSQHDNEKGSSKMNQCKVWTKFILL